MTLLRSTPILILVFVLSISNAVAAPAYSAGPGDKKKDDKGATGTVPTYDITGFAKLSSNFIDRGLSYSNNGFAMNAAFLVNLGSQLRFGFWGSNISKIENDDDNLWVKYVAEVHVDFQANSKFVFYVHDDHFYKAFTRNGIRYGFRLDYGRFSGLLEWQNNYEGTSASAYYTRIKFNKKYTEKTGLELGAGYTMEYSHRYNNYLDLLATGYYNAFPNGKFELGLTSASTSQFGSRSKSLNYSLGMTVTY